jgi:hypothetical protein
MRSTAAWFFLGLLAYMTNLSIGHISIWSTFAVNSQFASRRWSASRSRRKGLRRQF